MHTYFPVFSDEKLYIPSGPCAKGGAEEHKSERLHIASVMLIIITRKYTSVMQR